MGYMEFGAERELLTFIQNGETLVVISHEHKFVFVEVPHTGSHSISNELISLYGGETILRKHANLSQFLNQATSAEKSYFKFATVRNPLDYMVTHYLKLRTNHKGQFTNKKKLLINGGHITNEHLKQFQFVHDEGNDFTSYLRKFFNINYNNWFLVGHKHFDYVMRFENLQDEYGKVISSLGLEKRRPLPHINPTSRKDKKDYSQYYTDDIMEMVIRNFGPFMKKWGYEFPGDWNNMRVPFTSIVRFKVKDSLVNAISTLIELDPDAPLIRRAKKFIDSLI